MAAIRSARADREVDVDTDTYTMGASDAKRRKTRKGTHSCWACKRRKEKCIFERSSAICLGCQRRGIRCVSQEFADDLSMPSDGVRQMTDRMARIEGLVEHLIMKLDNNGTPAGGIGMRMPTSIEAESVRNHFSRQDQSALAVDLQFTADAPTGLGKHARLSQKLYELLPSLKDCDIISEARSRYFYMFIEILTLSYKTIDENGTIPENTLIRPGPQTHPVLIARYMLQLGQVLQQFYPNLDEQMKGLSEPPKEIMNRLVDNAINLVSTQTQLLGSIEGLECVMLETLYHVNNGNLRLSWAAGRRAMTIAQLMGLHQPGSSLQYQILDPKSKADPRLMWFRVVLFDRYLCLMLGLPQGSNDQSMAEEAILADDMPVGRLERIHCVLASRILARNESDPKSHDFALTQELDKELQRAARRFPSRWWLVPTLGNDDKSLFWDIKRMVAHMTHFNLLNRLHLPYMLRSSTEYNYEYSKIACVNASREILSRFVVLRGFDRMLFNCRMLDFLALMAAMTLLLAHLDSHRPSSQAGNLLVHQYLSDRAMMEQVQESMEEVSRLNADVFSKQGGDLLRRLLKIEAEAADGHTARAEGVSVQTRGIGDSENDDSDGVVRVDIPYFGVIKIAREGTISKEMATHHASMPHDSGQMQLPVPTGLAGLSHSKRAEADASVHSSQFIEATGVSTVQPQNIHVHAAANNGGSIPMESQAQGGLFDPLLPGLIAGTDDWTFQGVDMAFFDSLMGSADDGYFNAEMTWQNET
jgi:Fungal Zn(2)-Cys(6) binuclear cluster domain